MMSPRKTLATARRVLTQLRHDPQTIALIFIVPCALLVLMKYVYYGQTARFNQIEPLMLGIYPLAVMFLVTSITTLRERKSGTLDRLMSMSISKLDFILGYAIAFSLIAVLQAAFATWTVMWLLGVPAAGGPVLMLAGTAIGALLGTALGLLVSAFASTEFQAMQFLPVFIMPQLLTCGLFVPRNRMASLVDHFSDIMPMTYNVDAMQHVILEPHWTSALTHDFLVVIGYAVGVLILGAITIRRHD